MAEDTLGTWDTNATVWTLILSRLDNDRDFQQASLLCKASHTASEDVERTLAPRLLRLHGPSLVIYNLYHSHPERLTLPLLRALIDQGACLPRYLVLCLSREKDAQAEHKKNIIAHLEYRKQLQDQIELRARVLEEQRLEGARRLKLAADSIQAAEQLRKSDIPAPDDEDAAATAAAVEAVVDAVVSDPSATADPNLPSDIEAPHPHRSSMAAETAMMPLPVFPELKPVPAPEPLPITPTARLPPGIRDALISAGIEIYGRVFPPYPPPPTSPLERLSPNLHWLGRLPETSANPCYVWPPDDAAYFVFLIKYAAGAGTLTKPKESWAKICNGVRDLVQRYGFMPNMVVGSTANALGPWRNPTLDSLAPHAGASAGGVPLSITETHPWLPSEMFRYDRELALFLGRAAGIPEERLNDEILFWDLISANIHVPPNRYNPSPQAAEQALLKSLSHLPRPLPPTPVRRIILAHPSRALVNRLQQGFLARADLEAIGEDALSHLLGEPSNYGGVALNSADGIVNAFGFAEDVVARCFLAVGVSEVDGGVGGGADGAAAAELFDDVEDLVDSYWEEAGGANGDADDAIDPPVTETARPGASPLDRHRHMMTRQGRRMGTIQWTHWKWALARFGARHAATRACLNDLCLRESVEDPHAERRWQFADKEANAAVRTLVDEGVEPSMATVRRIAARVLRDARRREEGWGDGGYGAEASVVPPRFVVLMSKVEKLVLGWAGARSKATATPGALPKLTVPLKGEDGGSGPMSAKSEPLPGVTALDSPSSEKSAAASGSSAVAVAPGASGASSGTYRIRATSGSSAELKALAASLAKDGTAGSSTGSGSPAQPRSYSPTGSGQLRASPIPHASALRPRSVSSFDDLGDAASVASSTDGSKGAGPSPNLAPWLQLLRTVIIDSEAWRQVVSAYSAEALLSGGTGGGYRAGDPAEVRFYWATVRLVQDALDLSAEPGRLFQAWEEVVAERTASSASGGLGKASAEEKTMRRTSAPAGALMVGSGGDSTENVAAAGEGEKPAETRDRNKRGSAWEQAWARWGGNLSTSKGAGSS
ncbi:hypothetical protein HDU96_004680 [Phlyctochytrium bullatum]|nr:hypothetical protein HDU96_004680 [Phlyctochytrium bullatum]